MVWWVMLYIFIFFFLDELVDNFKKFEKFKGAWGRRRRRVKIKICEKRLVFLFFFLENKRCKKKITIHARQSAPQTSRL